MSAQWNFPNFIICAREIQVNGYPVSVFKECNFRCTTDNVGRARSQNIKSKNKEPVLEQWISNTLFQIFMLPVWFTSISIKVIDVSHWRCLLAKTGSAQWKSQLYHSCIRTWNSSKQLLCLFVLRMRFETCHQQWGKGCVRKHLKQEQSYSPQSVTFKYVL